MKKKLIHLFLITSLMLPQTLESVYSDNNPPLEGKTWLQELPSNAVLYSQQFLKNPAYMRLTKEQQQQQKVNYFLRKKFTPLNNKVMIYTVPFALSIPTIVASFLLFTKKSRDLGLRPQAAMLIQVYMGFLSAAFMPLYLSWGKLAYTALANRFWNRIDDPVQPLEVEYIKRKEFMPSGMNAELESQFSISRTDPTRLSAVLSFANTALKLPTNSLKIDFSKKKIDEAFKGYDSVLKDQVKAFSLRQVMMQPLISDSNQEQPHRQGKRVSAYFQGLPGSGKTRFAELAAEALGLPFARISLEGAREVSDLTGRALNSGNPTPGLIVEALTKAQINGKTAKNTVLFIDEADRVINDSKSEILPLLLKILDPENKSIFNPYLNTDVDTSNLTVILAGNYDIQDEALRKRLQVIEFKGFTTEFKKKIIWETTLKKMCTSYSNNGKYTMSMNDFNEADKQIIDKLIELDQDAGFRTIESVLMDYLDYKVMQKYFDPEVAFPPVVEKIKKSNLEQQQKKAITAA